MEGDELGLMLSPDDNQGEEPKPQSLHPMKWVAVLAVLALTVGLVGFAAGRSTAPSFTNADPSAIAEDSDVAEDAAGIVQEFLEDEREDTDDDDDDWPAEFFQEASDDEDEANKLSIPDAMTPQASPQKDAEARRLISASDKNAMMKYQNQIRCMHGVPLFKWSAALATNAQKWADTNQKSHSTAWGAFQKYGENMCWGQTVKQCVKFWYAEIKNTNGGRLKSANYGASHYSQLVWKQTHYVGCGKAHGIIVCQYKKRGNWAGQCPDCYASNVYGPKKSRSSCR
jgi:hypothetical protein